MKGNTNKITATYQKRNEEAHYVFGRYGVK